MHIVSAALLYCARSHKGRTAGPGPECWCADLISKPAPFPIAVDFAHNLKTEFLQ